VASSGTTASPAGSQAVDRAAALLVSVVESPEPRSFTSLVDEIGLARSTTSRLLQALERNKLVQRDRSGGFRAGSVFATFAVRHDRLGDLADLAQPTLDRLGQLTGETINLAVPDGTEIVQVSQVDGRHVLGAMNWLDVDVPPHCSAVGKLFYAFGSMPLPAGPLPRRTPETVTLAELRTELPRVRELGWASAYEELEPGLVAVAAPVWDSRGTVVAGISVSGPVQRVARDEVPRIAATLVAACDRLSRRLGHATSAARDASEAATGSPGSRRGPLGSTARRQPPSSPRARRAGKAGAA
jgi:IclR family acetate operon transcriptional repressor